MTDNVPAISLDELKAKIARSDRFTLVEILPPPLYRSGHLPGAIYIPPIQVRELAPKRLPDKSAEIVLYCAGPSCYTSGMAARELLAMGYTNVREFRGGKEAWVNAGLPLESTSRAALGRIPPRAPPLD
jgi:rhodanese-related sulfurtransferase